MFGVLVEGPTDIFCDNEVVYKNTMIPESVLRKKDHSISYQRCREAVTVETVRIAKDGTKTNLSDLITKILSIVKEKKYWKKSHIEERLWFIT